MIIWEIFEEKVPFLGIKENAQELSLENVRPRISYENKLV